MLRRTDIAPGMLTSLVVVLAIVAIMVPTCVMVGCSMSGGAMFVPFGTEASFSSSCGGTYLFSKSPVGTVPSDVSSVLISFVAALLVVAVAFSPRLTADPIRSSRDGPPPPPDSGDVPLRI